MNILLRSQQQIVIIDASALIALYQIDLAEVLPKLYGQVQVPDAVGDEIARGREEGQNQIPPFEELPWLQLRVTSPLPVAALIGRFPRLDPGEAAVLALAQSYPEGTATVLLDDRDARLAAAELGLPHPGVLGILLAAKSAGLITTVEPYLVKLRRLGFRISDQVYNDVLKLAGEGGGGEGGD